MKGNKQVAMDFNLHQSSDKKPKSLTEMSSQSTGCEGFEYPNSRYFAGNIAMRELSILG
jgi:hypothetical protein